MRAGLVRGIRAAVGGAPRFRRCVRHGGGSFAPEAVTPSAVTASAVTAAAEKAAQVRRGWLPQNAGPGTDGPGLLRRREPHRRRARGQARRQRGRGIGRGPVPADRWLRPARLAARQPPRLYALHDDEWYIASMRSNTRYQSLAVLTDAIAEALPAGSRAESRVTEMGRFYRFLNARLPALLDDWERERDGGGGVPRGEDGRAARSGARRRRPAARRGGRTSAGREPSAAVPGGGRP